MLAFNEFLNVSEVECENKWKGPIHMFSLTLKSCKNSKVIFYNKPNIYKLVYY